MSTFPRKTVDQSLIFHDPIPELKKFLSNTAGGLRASHSAHAIGAAHKKRSLPQEPKLVKPVARTSHPLNRSQNDRSIDSAKCKRTLELIYAPSRGARRNSARTVPAVVTTR